MISKISLCVWICLQRNLYKNERMKFKRKRKLCLVCFSVDGVLYIGNIKKYVYVRFFGFIKLYLNKNNWWILVFWVY